jgi:hypothetical protein
MPTRLTRFRVLTLAALAVVMTLRAENSEPQKKQQAVESPKVQPAPKAVSPEVILSTALSETVATNLTLATGTDQFIYAKTDFTGVDTVSIGFYAANTQDLSKTTYVTWWAIPNNTNYSAADTWTGASPVTYSRVTIWANAR